MNDAIRHTVFLCGFKNHADLARISQMDNIIFMPVHIKELIRQPEKLQIGFHCHIRKIVYPGIFFSDCILKSRISLFRIDQKIHMDPLIKMNSEITHKNTDSAGWLIRKHKQNPFHDFCPFIVL